MNHRTALLVIDVQIGAFNGERCPVIADAERLLANITRLVKKARSFKNDIVYVQHCAPKGGVLALHTIRWKLHPALEVKKSDLVVAKHESSAFSGTDLHDILQARHIENVIICGLQSEACVHHTVLSALSLGYRVTLAKDAHSTWPDAAYTAPQIVQRQNAFFSQIGAAVIPTDAIFARPST